MRGSATLGENLVNSKRILDSPSLIFSMDNEFLTLFGGTYDLLHMKKSGFIEDIPLQFKVFDLIMVLPKQILPFEKLDVQQWYVSQSENPGFFMFNPIAQSIIGFGWVELTLRGLFLGFIFTNLRAWCVRRDNHFALHDSRNGNLRIVSFYTFSVHPAVFACLCHGQNKTERSQFFRRENSIVKNIIVVSILI
jgi:hypothetical protein